MEEEYDLVMLGTGLKECILSGLLSASGKKVLNLDRNSYYGGESASLSLQQLFERFRQTEAPAALGKSSNYCIDLCPKFLMAAGDLVKILIQNEMTMYFEFKSIKGSYVYKDGKINKVPVTATEALESDLMGFFQKRKFKNFVSFCSNYNPDDKKTWDGNDPQNQTIAKVFDNYGLDEETQRFTGHAIALYENDQYLQLRAHDVIERIKLYAGSLARHGNSPYIYPLYGLGMLPESFSRRSAVYGGVYMLNHPIKRIVFEDGKAVGVEDSEGKIARCKQVVCDPSYVLEPQLNLNNADKVKLTGKIVRCICIMSHPLANSNTESAQVIIPAKAVDREDDIYMSVVSYHHSVAAQGKYIAVINSKLPGGDKASDDVKQAEHVLLPALRLLGEVDEKFLWVSNYYVPLDDGTKDQVFVTSSYDSSTHFEQDTLEVLRMYRAITGTDLDLNAPPRQPQHSDE